MRVEQQSQNIIDVVKQSIGPEEKSGAVLSQYTTGAAGAAVEKSSVSDKRLFFMNGKNIVPIKSGQAAHTKNGLLLYLLYTASSCVSTGF